MADIIQADIRDLMFDLKEIRTRLSQYKAEADRGINVNHAGSTEGEPKQDTIARLFYYLIDAKHDMDRIGDELTDLQDRLENLLSVAEYEAVAKRIR
jgi:predicted nuclease with TOPRIM domain